VRKASLVDFMGDGAEAAVWIDADMLLLADPSTELMAIVDDMASRNQSLAACADFASMTLDRYVLWCGTVGARIDQFKRDLEQRRIAGALDYLNSGFSSCALAAGSRTGSRRR
jgi:hypothetical protein